MNAQPGWKATAPAPPYALGRWHWLLLPLVGLFAIAPCPAPGDPPAATPVPPASSVAPSLRLPASPAGEMPKLLSETGVFRDLAALTPHPDLVAYQVNVPFWSDGAAKRRWLALRGGVEGSQKIGFRPTGEWSFPPGTLFVKHFELPTGDDGATSAWRIETRVLIYDGQHTRGATYRWRADQSEADLVEAGEVASLPVAPSGGDSSVDWYFPGIEDCATCHTPAAGHVLGVSTRQWNREVQDARGRQVNQLVAFARLGLFEGPPAESDVPDLPRLAPLDQEQADLELRSRSYLDANCAYCHRPGAAPAGMDLRFSVPLKRQHLVNGPVRINFGIDRARAIAPNDPSRSLVLVRMLTREPTKMPPLHQRADHAAVELLTRWIDQLPGPEVVAPPSITPSGCDSQEPITVTLHPPDREAQVHYTLDGTVPTDQSSVYRRPLRIRKSATLRARAFKSGCTESITVQETFIIFPPDR